MKSAVYLLSALVACIAARADADGVCYDPQHGPMTADAARKDMQTIKSKGFSHVRTYITDYGVDLADIVVKSGLRAALGIPYGDDNRQIHIDNAVKAAQSGMVDYIFVGNENAAKGLGDTAKIIRDIKSKVPGSVRVGTVQRSIDYIQPAAGMAEVVAASDVVGVNIHPFFHMGLTGYNAISEAKAQWKDVLNSGLPGIASKLILSETGWPSDGSNGNQGSVDSAAAYWADYKKWDLPDNQRFYFQMFDTPYKGGFEAKYGLLGADSTPKFAAGGNPAPAPTAAPTTAAPTPAPSTTAPATTPPATTPAVTTGAPSNSTTSASQTGSTAGEAGDAGSKAGSGSVGEEAGSSLGDKDSSSNVDTESNAQNEAGVTDMNTDNGAAGTSDSTGATSAGGATRSTGDNKADGSVEATTKSAASAGSVVGVVVVAAFGVAAVGAAFAFIYKARQKAAELESSERKSFDSFAITPGGGCAL